MKYEKANACGLDDKEATTSIFFVLLSPLLALHPELVVVRAGKTL